jgi:hypothetical protein
MMRGDTKWPPEQTRQQMLEEKVEQEMIAAGPKERPTKQKKVKFLKFIDVLCCYSL